MTRTELLENAKPIIFSTPMVQAILDDRKTQTRRVVKPKYSNTHFEWFTNKYGTRFIERENAPPARKLPDGSTVHTVTACEEVTCPAKTGDILWVRETWAECTDMFGEFPQPIYKSDFTAEECGEAKNDGHRWRPSIFMPRASARIFLHVTDVRAERVQEISAADARAEGCPLCIGIHNCGGCDERCEHMMPREWYRGLWDKLNAKRGYGWDENPWVWVYKFERVVAG